MRSSIDQRNGPNTSYKRNRVHHYLPLLTCRSLFIHPNNWPNLMVGSCTPLFCCPQKHWRWFKTYSFLHSIQSENWIPLNLSNLSTNFSCLLETFALFVQYTKSLAAEPSLVLLFSEANCQLYVMVTGKWCLPIEDLSKQKCSTIEHLLSLTSAVKYLP